MDQASVIVSPTVVKQLFSKELATFVELDDKIEKQTAKVLEAEVKQDALEEALKLEYLVSNYRSKLNSVLGRIQQMFDMEQNSAIKMSLKQYEAEFIKKSSRLTDLREDLNSLQKLAYTARNIF
jgi:hypothetical protein